MTSISKRLVLTAAIALAAAGNVWADSGDNSMAPYNREAHGGFGGSTSSSGYPTAEPADSAIEEGVASTRGDVIIGLPRGYNNPFRDDTAA